MNLCRLQLRDRLVEFYVVIPAMNNRFLLSQSAKSIYFTVSPYTIANSEMSVFT